MATALDIIQDALEMIGVYDPGDSPSDADAERGLSVLNDMLDSWSNESLACFAVIEQTGVLSPGFDTYTIGPGGSFPVTRPLRINDDAGSAYLVDNNGNKYSIDVVGRSQWNLTTTSPVNSTLPDTLFYDAQFPLGVIKIWPTPTMAFSIFFDSHLQLTDFPSLAAAFTFPPGYKLAITANLAVALHPYFADGQINAVVALRADRSLANIKRTNIRPSVAVFDPELIARGYSTYNIRRDR